MGNLRALLLFFGLMLLGNQALMAQSSSQVNIVGIPPVLSTPQANAIEQNFKNGQYQVIFNYSSFSSQPVDFVFDFRLVRNNRTILELESLPRAFTPGSYVFTSFFEEVDFRETPNDVLDMIGSDLRNQIVQSGSIPEGNYSIEITARPFTGQTGINTMPGSAIFSVRYPPPPILVSVPDGANVLVDTPTFSWTPVVSSNGGMFEYEFLLVEVFRGQTPLQAINSNRELAFETLVGQTTLPYTMQYLPLEEGATYAWQVRAKDVNGQVPLQQGGESEIYTFTFRDRKISDEAIASLDELEEINLVPGFATVDNFSRLEIEETSTSYIISGPARMNLDFITIGDIQLEAVLERVEIQKAPSLQTPILMGGDIIAKAQGMKDLASPLSDYVEIPSVSWSFTSGLTADLSISTPERSGMRASGNMSLNRMGMSGRATATGSPLISFGEGPLNVDLTELTIVYPEAQIRAKTEARFLGEELCEIPEFALLNENFRIRLNCEIDKDIPMVDQSDLLVLNLEDVSGEIIGSLGREEFDFNLAMRSNIDLQMTGDNYCGGSTFIQYSSEDGLNAGQFTPTCTLPRPELDLGFLKASVNNIALEELIIGEDGSDLEFDVRFDSQLSFPNNPALALPEMEDIRITNTGITFPDALFEGNDIPVNNSFELGDFELQLERFDLGAFTFPWFDWNGEGVGPWSFSFDAGMELPMIANLPGCFSSTTLGIQNASVSSDGDGELAVMGTINADDVASCSWEIGPGFSLDIHNIGGNAVLKRSSDGFSARGDLNFDADFNVDEPFTCGDQSSFELNDLTVSLDKGMSGEVSIQDPDCPLQIGPYTADINQAALNFSYHESDGQQISMSGGATLDLGNEQSAVGSFTLDLRTGQFSDINFEIDGPFEWGIPREEPVLVFTIDEASISNEGLMIDGRQSLELGDSEVGTTFDQLLINWDTYEILGGRIIFDEAFNLAAGVDLESNSLQFEASTDDSTSVLSPGVLMGLAGTVQIDSLGVHSTGAASAAFNVDGLDIGDLVVEYSDDFAFGLNPFGIRSGNVDFNWDGQRVAYANDAGFYPDLSFFSSEFLPDRIPLPNHDVAYLRIRNEETGDLIISTERQENGTFLIETLEDQELMLTLPILQREDEAVPPAVAVQLNDLVINPSNGRYVSGSVYTTVQDGSNLGNRPNLPFTLKEIQYSNGENEAGDEFHALFLSGSLHLFDQVLGEQDITLYAESDGFIRGGVSMPNLDASIPLDGPDGHVVLSTDSLSGGFEWNPQNIAASQFDIDINGGFEILDFEGNPVVRSQVNVNYDQYGVSLNDFSFGEDFDGYAFDFGTLGIEIPGINTLSLSYSEIDGFDYYADLDFNLNFDINGQSIPFPLKNVEIRKGLGFVIPSQDIHDESIPGLSLPSIEFGAFKLEPLALRMDRDTIDVNNFSAGDLLNIIPDIDFDFSMPGFEDSIPELANLNLTVQGANFTDGIFNGDILPLEFDEIPLFLPLGSGAGINLSEIGGSLFSEGEGQGFSVNLDGGFVLPDFFSDADDSCVIPDVSLDVTSEGYFTGQVADFEPCGDIDLGGLKLNFGETLLEFSHEEGEQFATIEGGVTVEIESTDGQLVETTGFLKYDLINGGILDGSVQIDTQFPWQFPRKDSIFEFYVNSATLNSNGLVVDADGNLQLDDDASIDVTFNNLTLDLSTFELTDGSVEFANSFALDVGFGPRTWGVSNPATDPEFNNGVRMTVPGNVEMSHDGLLVSGQAASALYFGDDIYDAISVDFVDTRFLFSPNPQISEGRADFLHQEEDDEEPVRLAWFDSEGFHPDNLAGAVTLPDTLGLPNKDIAYIVLRDEAGQNLVQSENVEDGLKIFTTDPVDLVIQSFTAEAGEPYTVSVEFDDLVINAAMEVASGGIVADLTGTPLSLQDDLPLPLGIQQLEYKRQSGEHKLFADVKVDLPGELSQLAMMVEDILLTEDGFEDVTFAFGHYSESYDVDADTVIASAAFADDNFEVAVRGAEFGFGSDRFFRFSGDVKSQLFRNDDGEMAVVHLAAGYGDSDWNFTVDTAHLVPQRLPIAMSELILEDVGFEQIDEHFALVVDSRLVLPDILGDETEIGITGLRVGTNGVSLEGVDTETFSGQKLTLFGQQDILTIEALGIEVTDDLHLIAALDGSLDFLGRSFEVDDLKIGTDGTFSMGEGGINLIADGPVSLLGENLVLTTLEIGMVESVATLTALADLELPEPVETSSVVGFSVNQYGQIDVQQPDINFSGVSKEIPGFATISLDDAGFELNNLDELDFGFYAMASVEAGGETIRFGDAGNPENWGIRYAYGESLEWRITNSPSFVFENEMFTFSVDGVQVETDESFVLEMSVGAELRLSGVSGSIAFDGMKIDAGGEFDLGTFSETSLDIGPVKVELTSLDYKPRNEDGSFHDLTIDQATGDPGSDNSEVKSEPIDDVIEYLSFGGEMTIPGGFDGSVEEILFYRTPSEVLFRVKNFHAELNDLASITASLEYHSVGSEFELMVAGAAQFTPPEGDPVGLAAMGRMGNIGGEFSFGIFVKADVTVPIFPGALTMTSFGAGFFYNAKSSDFAQILSLTDHEITSDSPPWEEEGGGYDFAIVAYAGVGIAGEAGTYAIEGSAILLITEKWLVLDVDGQVFDGEAAIDVGMYLSVQWNPGFRLNGEVTASMENAVADANFGMSISVFKSGDDIVWAMDGNLDVVVLNTLTFDGTIIAGVNGFYLDLGLDYQISISIIDASVSFDLAVWWVKGEQFGAYIEFNAMASALGLEGEAQFKGGLIIDNSYLIYAYGKVSGDVPLLGEGSIDLYVAIDGSGISGGLGYDEEYERALADARAEAQEMNSALTEALEAANDLDQVINDHSQSVETLAEAGENILGSSNFTRTFLFGAMLSIEGRLANEPPPVYDAIFQMIKDVESLPDKNSYDLAGLRQNVEDATDILSASLDQINSELANLEAEVIDYQEQADRALEDIITSPVQNLSLTWEGDRPPEFDIDSSTDSANRGALEEYKEDMDALEQQFEDAIASIQTNISILEGVLFSDEAGINKVAGEYHEVTKSIDKLYTNMAAHQWDIHRWAEVHKNLFLEVDGDLESAVVEQSEAMLSWEGIEYDFEAKDLSSSDSGANYDQLAEIAAIRHSIIINNTADGSDYMSDMSSVKSDLLDDVSNGYIADFSEYFVTRGKEFWYDVPLLGYESLAENAAAEAEAVNDAYEEILEPILENYIQFTQRIDDLYANKHSIHSTYDNILNQYISWRNDVFNGEGVDQIQQIRDENLQYSKSPDITSLSASRTQDGFENKLTVDWSVSHSSGINPENSYYISDDSNSDIFTENYLSVGSSKQVERYLFKRDVDERSRSLAVRVRAKGPTGLSRTKTYSLSPNLNPPMPVTGDRTWLKSIDLNLKFNATLVPLNQDHQPEKPSLSVPYPQNEYSYYTQVPSYTGSGTYLISVDASRYWTNRSDRIEFSASSYDDLYDIAGFEFMVGTSPNDSTITGWTEQVGTPVNGSASNHQAYEFYNINLVEGEEYYVTVRAINGEGVKSEPESIGPIMLDTTVPTQPSSVTNSFNHPAVETLSSTVARSTPKEDAVIELQWSASSVSSGSDIYRYKVLVSTDNNHETAEFSGLEFFTEGNTTSLEIVSDQLEFDEEYYFYVMAEDFAGNLSEPLVLGPEMIVDPTSPTTLDFNVRIENGIVGINLTKGASDPESGVDYYEYGFFHASNGQQIYGAGGTFDPSSGQSTGTGNRRGSSGSDMFSGLGGSSGSDTSFIPLSMSNLPEGVPLNVAVRAVNGQGVPSETVQEGAVVYDSSKPEISNFAVLDDDGQIKINLNGAEDPQSGIKSVKYKIKKGSQTVRNWTTLRNFMSPSFGVVTGSATFNLNGNSASEYKVYIQVENGNGMVQTDDKVPSVPIQVQVQFVPVNQYNLILAN
ncbi:hypothetical protein [Rhodohalobacter halophilus]|uniref:hypothetical protein n=1 Tax=Rhodohalobacter halophilus TaxID=1812810 RepID=UPI00114C9484|nr:hypothetical protein [Rhodohalobacter halophilus]